MGQTSITSRSIPLPALRMQVLEAGPASGPLVLLLHGFPELSESWRDVLPRLGAEGFHAVAPDLRGYGGTDRPRSGYDIDTLAGDVVQLARYLQPGRPAHLVGHDWGGGIAYHVAAWHPDVVDRLAVVNCPHPSVMSKRVWWPPQLARSWYMFFFQLPLLPERLLSTRGGALVPWLIRRAMVDASRVSDERLAPYAAHFAHPDAARAAGRLGVSFLTVHASGGEAMLRAAVKGVREGASERGHAPPRILAVTVLTSLSDADLSAIGYREGASESVRRLGALCQRAGVDGLVCSPREAKDLRDALGQALFLCTPGIRPAGSAAGDQARAETPAFAARAGADLLVVGRPIYAAADPLVAARALEAEVSAA